MELVATEAEGVRIVRLLGTFELTELGRFDAAVQRAVDEGCVRLVLDAAEVHLVCSAALGSFLRAQEQLRELGGELVCAALPSFAQELFRTLGLDRRMRCFATVDEAVRALAVP